MAMDFKDGLQDIKNTLIEQNEVFDAVRRGYSDLEFASEGEILTHFSLSSPSELQGHVSNIKGILFEQEVQDKLLQEGIDSKLFEATNHPDSDLQIFDNGFLAEEFQLKATDSTSYVNAALAENPSIDIIATSEVANAINSEDVINSGISETVLEETVLEVISPISPIGLAFSGIGLFFGLPF
jgi:hypothetical protein